MAAALATIAARRPDRPVCAEPAAATHHDPLEPGAPGAPEPDAIGPTAMGADRSAPAGRPASLGLHVDRRARTGLLLVGWIPLVDLVVWQLVQRARFGELPVTSSGDNNLSLPLAGLAEELGRLVPPGGGDEAFRLLSVAALVGLLAAAGWCWRASRATFAERVAWFPAVAVVVLLNDYLWSGATAFMRATTEAGLLSLVIVLGSGRDRLLRLVTLGTAGLWLLTAASQVAKLG